MKVRHFTQADTSPIELQDVPVAEMRDLDENTVLDIDSDGHICAITIEPASKRAGVPQFSCEQIAARGPFRLQRRPSATTP